MKYWNQLFDKNNVCYYICINKLRAINTLIYNSDLELTPRIEIRIKSE